MPGPRVAAATGGCPAWHTGKGQFHLGPENCHLQPLIVPQKIEIFETSCPMGKGVQDIVLEITTMSWHPQSLQTF